MTRGRTVAVVFAAVALVGGAARAQDRQQGRAGQRHPAAILGKAVGREAQASTDIQMRAQIEAIRARAASSRA